MAIHFRVLLAFALCTISVSGQLLWSIDCGAPATSITTDANLVPWMGDGDFFQKGTSAQMVQSSNSISKVMDTLRVFTARNKNCYDLKVGADTQVLVRASFNYGNYDKKSSPPSFDLQFDGNSWVTVETSATGVVYYEVIYVTKGDYLSVCLAQTKDNQIPFISALEVRGLESHMYAQVNSTVALFLQTRVAYGATSPIRFADDIYDRIWEPAKVEDGQVVETNDAIFIADLYLDQPPQAVLQNAITSSSKSVPLILDTGLPSTTSLTYINWYFTEVTDLSTTSQTRSFEVFVNNRSISDPILPPYQNTSELFVSQYSVPSGAIFSLVATSDSDLPPVISGMEVFTVSDTLTQGTNVNDVEGLVSLQTAFSILNDWGGDPCLPLSYSWEWVNCSTDDIPRITAINLKGYGLEGLIPNLSSMDALQTIDFENNNLVGPLPDSLGSIASLKQLNVANNKLSGPIPTSLSKNNKLNLVWTGNPSLCKSGCDVQETPGFAPANPSSGGGNTPVYVITTRKKKSKTPVIVGTTIPVFIIFWALVGLSIVLRKRKHAAVAAALAGGNRPQPHGKPQGENGHGINSEMPNDSGEAVMNDFTADIDPTSGQTSNQHHQQV